MRIGNRGDRHIWDDLSDLCHIDAIGVANGQKAYDVICQCKNDGTLDQHVKVLITDIEMPEMDGHRLTKLDPQHGLYVECNIKLIKIRGDEQALGLRLSPSQAVLQPNWEREREAMSLF